MSASATPISTPVTGTEYRGEQQYPMQALAQFYLALNSRDFTLMQKNWDHSPEAAMDNPLGGIKRGWNEIRVLYERLFASPGKYHFEFHDYTFHEVGDIFYVVGRERGTLNCPTSGFRSRSAPLESSAAAQTASGARFTTTVPSTTRPCSHNTSVQFWAPLHRFECPKH